MVPLPRYAGEEPNVDAPRDPVSRRYSKRSSKVGRLDSSVYVSTLVIEIVLAGIAAEGLDGLVEEILDVCVRLQRGSLSLEDYVLATNLLALESLSLCAKLEEMRHDCRRGGSVNKLFPRKIRSEGDELLSLLLRSRRRDLCGLC